MEEIEQLVEAILGVQGVGPTDRLAEDLEAESMDVVNIVAALEERYGVTLDDEVVAGVFTVGDLHDAVQTARA